MTEPPAGATTIFPDSTKASAKDPVTFVCQNETAPVLFSAPNFTFYPAVSRIVMRGGCFRFHIVRFGYGGSEAVTANVTLDEVHMESFECGGCASVTIKSSEIGPVVACYGVGQLDVPESAKCDPSKPAEAYWAAWPDGSSSQPTEPYIHQNTIGAKPTNFVLVGNTFHDIQTKDSAVLHTGCFQTGPGGDAVGLVIRGNRFVRCAIYDVLLESGDTGVTIEDNFFGAPYTPMDGGAVPVETAKDWREVDVKTSPGVPVVNFLIRRNSFAHGLSLDNSAVSPEFHNVLVSGNILGIYSYCPPSASFTANIFIGQGCGDAAAAVRFGYVLADGRLKPDGARATSVRAAFGAAATGLHLSATRRLLRKEHQPAPPGGWTLRNLRNVLTSHDYLGGVYGPPGAHPALVSRSAWQKAQKTVGG
jgi:hypothetical protein